MGEREECWVELVRAGTVMFGAGFARIAHEGRWGAELRSTYRKRALETHPDRAVALGRRPEELLRQFREVTEAYALLSAHLLAPSHQPAPSRQPPASPRPAPRARPAPAATTRPAAAPASRPAPAATAAARLSPVGPLPGRRLRMAEFLYYSGRITWPQFVAAIAWQRQQRPSLGRLAVELGFLDQRTVAALLERRRHDGVAGEPFGQFAVRCGRLTASQLLTLLGRQQRQQRRIGAFFSENGLLLESELEAARVELSRHNARVASRAA